MIKKKKATTVSLSFFELTPDLVCVASKEGFFEKVNHSVIEKLGYTEEELFASPISSFMYPDDREQTAGERAELLSGKPMINFQNRYVSKKGNIIWLDWTAIYFPDKEIVFAIAKDVTERKKIELETEEAYLKFKNLATHFKDRIEKDRKYFASELHEEVAQLASVIKMDVDWLNFHLADVSPSVRKKIEHAEVVSGLLINTIRRISFSISPLMLNDIGLNETLEWLCKEFTILNKIPCVFETNYEETETTQDIKLDVFRICQEALKNIMLHAQASSAKISIETMGDKICVSIIDNGKGFNMQEKNPTPGLIAMRHQAASINGQLHIDSEMGKGTKISIFVTK